MIGDSVYNILWQLLENAGGVPALGDLEHDLLRKYLDAIKTGVDDENDPRPGDPFIVLLAKVVRRKGGLPAPGDSEWNLLVKWLALEGECRRCGDLIHALWQKILETILGAEAPCAPSLITSPTLENQTGQFVFLSWDWSGVDPASFRIEQSINGGGYALVSNVDGGLRDELWAAPPSGSTLVVRIRSENPTTCWVVSNTIVIDAS